MDNIKIQTEGDYKFEFFIEKAIPEMIGKDMVIRGIASTTNIDHDNERMSKEALASMAEIINKDTVPLRVEHRKEDSAVIGAVNKAWIDERNQLWIEAQLDGSHPASPILYNSLKEGTKMGLSVGGRVKKAVKELSEKTGKMVKTFYSAILDEVSVTNRPANYDAWLVAKHIVNKGDDVSRFYKSSLYSEFLFENPNLDYLQTFAKSIQNAKWEKVEVINKENTMNDKETTEKAESQDTKENQTEKSVSREEFNTLKSMMAKGFHSLVDLITKMTGEATDQNNPSEAKPETPGDTGEKAQSTDGDKTEKDMDISAERQAQPKEEMIDHEVTADAGNMGKAAGDAVRREGQENTDGDGDVEKGEPTGDETAGSEWAEGKKSMSIDSAIARMQKLQKDMSSKTDETEKDMGTDEGKETTKSQKPASIDKFVETVVKTMDAFKKKMDETGYSIPAFEKQMINIIRDNPELQKEIKEMLREPGFKKSVSRNIPYVTTKEGRTYSLVPIDQQEEVKKSVKEAKDFKTLYKSDFSAFSEENLK